MKWRLITISYDQLDVQRREGQNPDCHNPERHNVGASTRQCVPVLAGDSLLNCNWPACNNNNNNTLVYLNDG